jgi:phage shock protein A
MLKTGWTLIRGAFVAASEEITDRNVLLILDQQIRDAVAATEQAKRALALAIAQDQMESKRLEATLGRIADLETRTVAALAAGREDFVGEATETIAALEADRDAIRETRTSFARDIAHMKASVAGATRRLAELERGRRVARAAEAVSRLQAGVRAGTWEAAALADAEATLQRLRARQAEDSAAAAALRSLDSAAPEDLSDRMEAAGLGPRKRTRSDDVLARLRERATRPDPASPASKEPKP